MADTAAVLHLLAVVAKAAWMNICTWAEHICGRCLDTLRYVGREVGLKFKSDELISQIR